MSKFSFKEKTENYKKYVKKVEDDVYSRESDSNETIILTNDVNEIHVSFSFNLFYLYTYYYILGFYNFKIVCDEELKPSIEKFIRDNYFDKDVFDFDDDE
jgi:hypothetical protein